MSPARTTFSRWPTQRGWERRRHPFGGADIVIRQGLPMVYGLIGVLVAAQHGYLADLTALGRVLSAVLAVVLWPLVVFGIGLTIV
jgi:hypothetical protein